MSSIQSVRFQGGQSFFGKKLQHAASPCGVENLPSQAVGQTTSTDQVRFGTSGPEEKQTSGLSSSLRRLINEYNRIATKSVQENGAAMQREKALNEVCGRISDEIGEDPLKAINTVYALFQGDKPWLVPTRQLVETLEQASFIPERYVRSSASLEERLRDIPQLLGVRLKALHGDYAGLKQFVRDSASKQSNSQGGVYTAIKDTDKVQVVAFAEHLLRLQAQKELAAELSSP